MAGGLSSQKNKAHKGGRRAGQGARARNRDGNRPFEAKASKSNAAMARAGKESRAQSAASARAKSRASALERRRHVHAPLVIQMLALSAALDVQSIWDVLLSACHLGSDVQSLRDFNPDAGVGTDMATEPDCHPLKPTTLAVPGRHRMRVMLLPPLPAAHRCDPFAIADVAKAADIVLLCMPMGDCLGSGPVGQGGKGGKKAAAALAGAALDADGALALQMLRSMGLPQVLVALQGAGEGMKERSAAKRAAAAALASELPGDLRIAPLDALSDCVQLLRSVVEIKVEAPVWRRQRPALVVQGATYDADAKPDGAAAAGVLYIDAYVRQVGLSANQLVTVPGAGDFPIGGICAVREEVPLAGQGAAAGGGCAAAPLAMDADATVLALPDQDRERVVRENEAADMDEEQTWPTADEVADADAKRRLAPGTSAYQACWILDDDEYEVPADDDDAGEGGDAAMADDDAAAPALVAAGEAGEGDAMADGDDHDGDDGSGGDDDDDDGAADAEQREAMRQRLRRERRNEAAKEDLDYPDEVETPSNVPARVRFQKYRGLKSFRSSAWDDKEDLPRDYARVFAFENFARARKRALQVVERAVAGTEPGVVAAGTYVRVALLDVPRDAAAAVCSRVSAHLLGAAPPLTAFGMLRHECKLSVVNMAVTRAAAYDAPVANKEEVTVITGLRTFTTRPVLSTAEFNADKFKMERYMHHGRSYVMSCFAPIAYPPLPAIIVKRVPGGPAQVIATGAVQGCNPDRVVLKKIILTGYPVRVHKQTAIVRYMFFNPDDVKWFKPLDLWTKYGRRGRIKEPVGTHGAMKCLFDAPVQQRDSVCITLYKRAFPKWPEDMRFA